MRILEIFLPQLDSILFLLEMTLIFGSFFFTFFGISILFRRGYKTVAKIRQGHILGSENVILELIAFFMAIYSFSIAFSSLVILQIWTIEKIGYLTSDPLMFFGSSLLMSTLVGLFAFLILNVIVFVSGILRNIKGRIVVSESGESEGIVIGLPFTYLTLIFLPKRIEKLKGFIEAHEMGHILGHHITKLVIWNLSTVFIFGLSLLIPAYFSKNFTVHPLSQILISSFSIFSIVFLIFLIRICEIQADLNAFKKYGSNAYDLFLEFIKDLNVNHPSKMPFLSRLTHTGRRDITLTTGDPIAALTSWEIPLTFSLLYANIGLIMVHIVFKRIFNIELSPLVFITLYLFFLLMHLVLSFLLAFIIRLIISRFTNLTDRSKLNLSLLISSIYLVFASIILSLFLIDALTALITIPISYLMVLLAVWYFIRDKWKSLVIATVSFMIFILANILILASRAFVRL
ncbi:MAG: M48 family metalloprotease [Ignisphaera sp.]